MWNVFYVELDRFISSDGHDELFINILDSVLQQSYFSTILFHVISIINYLIKKLLEQVQFCFS